jgi:mannose-6-phosphate isomerase-like protein (cupin superfamily)
MRLALITAAALIAGCTTSQRTVILADGSKPVESLLAARPADPGKNITAYLLDQSERTSRHLIWVRDGEQPHVHATHDLMVTVLSGQGILWMGGQPFAMEVGDTAVVSAGTPHYFLNRGDEPAAAFVVFAPPSDGSDNVPVTTKP